MKYILLFAFFVNNVCFAANAKELTVIVIGSGCRLDQEYSKYAQDLHKKGYKITIHSFDNIYDEKPTCVTNSNGESIEENFDGINYIVYEDTKKDFILAVKYDHDSHINLNRYAVNLFEFNRTGSYIKQIFGQAVKNNDEILFIDGVQCCDLRPITKYLFDLYQEKAIFVHSIYQNNQAITKDLLGLNKTKVCKEKPKGEYKYYGYFKKDKTVKNWLAMQQKIHKYIDYESLNQKQENDLADAIEDIISSVSIRNCTTCVNESLRKSDFKYIDENFIESLTNSANKTK